VTTTRPIPTLDDPTPSSDEVVRFEDVRKSYRKSAAAPIVHALKRVSFHIPRGEYLAIMGPSGSGKSTLLNILGCLDRPTSGSYLLEHEDVSRMSDTDLSDVRGRRLGFVFQAFNLIAAHTVLENIEVPLFYQSVNRRLRRERAEAAAASVGLADRLHHRPSELSGGQQQRVAIARALVSRPSVLLADEPTGNLDSATGESILELFESLHEQGLTIIMVTHDPAIAERCQRVIWLHDGDIDRIETGGRA